MVKTFSLLALFLVISPLTYTQERPASLIENRVTFSLPSHWEIQTQENTDKLGRIQILIPYPETDNTPHSANVAIVANLAPKEITIKEIGDQVYGKSYPGMGVVNDTPDGKEWRTIIWTAHNGVPYLSLNRFGCSNGVAVEVLVAFPLLENGNQKWIGKTISDFNAFCESLKIDGKNTTEAKVQIGELPPLEKKTKKAPVPKKKRG